MSEAARIARQLRGRPSANGYLCRCPLPSHGRGRGDRSPSLLIKDGAQAVLVKCFAGCEAKDIPDELRRRGMVSERSDEQSPQGVYQEHPPDHKPNPEAIELWRTATAIAPESLQVRYLQARGLTIYPPQSLRAASILHLDRYPFPAIVAAVQAPDRCVIAVQRTLLDPRGHQKAPVRLPRMTIGALGWGAIRLAASTQMLGLAEGTEKALAAMQLFGVPCWSSLGAGRMHRVRIPDDVTELHVFLDNDNAGRAAAERTAHAHRHRKVLLHFPPEQFKDWDDVTRANEQSAA